MSNGNRVAQQFVWPLKETINSIPTPALTETFYGIKKKLKINTSTFGRIFKTWN
jgi:hypothetical protein